jgi:hypothetical protein
VEGVDQAVDGVKRVLFGGVGQMRVACSGGGAGVAEEGLNMPKTQAVFEQVGGETVAKGVNRYFF